MDDQFLPQKPINQETPQNMPGEVIMPGSLPPNTDAAPSQPYTSGPSTVEPLTPVPQYPQPTEAQPPAISQSPVPNYQSPEEQFAATGVAIPEEVPDMPKPRKRLRTWILIVIGVIIVGGAATAAVLILSKKAVKKTPVVTKPVQNDVQLIRYGALDGTLNHFAPTLDNNPTTVYLNKQIFEPLVGYESGTKTVPILVQGWTNPDSTTWVFNLKANIKFHDGNTMSAKDVVYSYQQYKNNPAFASEVTSTIKSVEAPADDQIKITTNGPDPLLLNRLTDLLIVDSSAAGKVDPVYGTGPYQVKPGTTPDTDHIDLVAFDNFHGGHIYTKEVQMAVYRTVASQAVTGQAAALNDMKAGKLDIIGALKDTTLGDALSLTLTQLPIENPPIYSIIPNTLKKGSPLASQKVRQAIYDALDVDTILKVQNTNGKAQSQPVTSYIPGYNDAVTRPTKDTDAATRLVREAGYPNGTSFTLTIPAAFTVAGTEIAAELKTVGITVKLDPQADPNKVQSDGAAGKLDAYYSVDSSLYNDASDVYARELQSKNYTNPAIDSLLAQAGATLNQTDRLNYLQQVAKTAMDDTAVIPLYSSQQLWFTTNNSLVMPQDLLKNDFGIYFYKVYSKN